MTKKKQKSDDPIVIKKYANRRLYDTGRSSYVTLSDLSEMIKDGYDFVVVEAKSGEDITRSVLTQIIADQESKGENLLPIGFLKNLIGLYGENFDGFLPKYLENTLEIFAKNQERMREQFSESLQGMNPMKNMFPGAAMLEEMNRQNMAIFEQTMKMFTGYNREKNANEQNKTGSKKTGSAS